MGTLDQCISAECAVRRADARRFCWFFRVIFRLSGQSEAVNFSPYRAFMNELAEESGALIRQYFGQPDLGVEFKADQSPVTIADRGAEQLMRQRIRSAYPEHGIIGEEMGNERENAAFVWVLDPIDGTKSFASACPLFGTLIALLYRGQPVLGAIHQPVLRQLM